MKEYYDVTCRITIQAKTEEEAMANILQIMEAADQSGLIDSFYYETVERADIPPLPLED